MTTPHIEAGPGDFADLVLMPGDPLRAKALAEGFLEAPRLVNSVRNMLGFTGHYKGRRVSIMGSGMGMPSISIYAHELFTFFDVQSIVRVGTCGALTADLALGDLLLASAASTDSAMNRARFQGWDYAAAADADLLRRYGRWPSNAICPSAAAKCFPRTGSIILTRLLSSMPRAWACWRWIWSRRRFTPWRASTGVARLLH